MRDDAAAHAVRAAAPFAARMAAATDGGVASLLQWAVVAVALAASVAAIGYYGVAVLREARRRYPARLVALAAAGMLVGVAVGLRYRLTYLLLTIVLACWLALSGPRRPPTAAARLLKLYRRARAPPLRALGLGSAAASAPTAEHYAVEYRRRTGRAADEDLPRFEDLYPGEDDYPCPML